MVVFLCSNKNKHKTTHMDPNKTINIRFGESILISFNEKQLKYLCLIAAGSRSLTHVVKLLSNKCDNTILREVSALIKRRAIFINYTKVYSYEDEQNLLGELHTIAHVIDVLT